MLARCGVCCGVCVSFGRRGSNLGVEQKGVRLGFGAGGLGVQRSVQPRRLISRRTHSLFKPPAVRRICCFRSNPRVDQLWPLTRAGIYLRVLSREASDTNKRWRRLRNTHLGGCSNICPTVPHNCLAHFKYEVRTHALGAVVAMRLMYGSDWPDLEWALAGILYFFSYCTVLPVNRFRIIYFYNVYLSLSEGPEQPAHDSSHSISVSCLMPANSSPPELAKGV